MVHPTLSLSGARKRGDHANDAPWLKPLTLACLLTLALPPAPAHAQSPITFQYIYDDLNQLTKVIDSTGVVIQYVYDPVGNILQINRSTVVPGALTIFNITPLSAPAGTNITIQGQGFSANPALDVVTIGGVAVTVVSATSTTLVVTVPAGAMSGSIAVTVGNVTATSSSTETVIPAPIITSVKPRVMQAGATASVTVTGANFATTTFSIPGSGITAIVASVTPDGASAVLTLAANATANGRYGVVGNNGAASSATGVTAANFFSVFVDPTLDPDGDGLPNGLELILGTDPFNADTDGDGFSDGVEVASGSNPLDPACTPLNCRLSGTSTPVEIDALPFGVLNLGPAGVTIESDSFPFGVLNLGPAAVTIQSDSFPFGVLNTGPAGASIESDSVPFSVLMAGATKQSPFEADSLPFSVATGTPPNEADSVPFSLCNGSSPCTGYGPLSKPRKPPGIGTSAAVITASRTAVAEAVPVIARTPRRPFAVLAVAPANGAINLSPRQTVALAFSAPLDPASINARNFWLAVGDHPLEAELRYSTDFRTVMLRAALPPDASIRVSVSGQVQDLWGRQLPAFESEFRTAKPSVDSVSVVIAQSPPMGATGVGSDLPAIRLYLARAIDAGAANALRITQDGDPVEGAVRVAEGGKLVDFVPATPLRSGAVAQVALAGYEGLFTTASPASQAAEALRTVPGRAADAALNPVIEIEYSRPLDPTTVAAGSVTLNETSTSQPVRAGIVLRGDRIIRISPEQPLTPNTSYTFEVSASVLDLTGQSATPLQQSLNTGTESVFGSPRLLSAAPADGATDVEPTAEIRLSFDRAVNPLTLSSETVLLIQDGVREPVSISLANEGREIVLAPNVPLNASSRVQVTVTGIEDLSGSGAPPATIRFQVRAASRLLAERAPGKARHSFASGLFSAQRRLIGLLFGRRSQ